MTLAINHSTKPLLLHILRNHEEQVVVAVAVAVAIAAGLLCFLYLLGGIVSGSLLRVGLVVAFAALWVRRCL